jgi:Uma2 family endonuclease
VHSAKFGDCVAHGVSAYWIIDPCAGVVKQYVLDDDSPESDTGPSSNALPA